MAEEPLSPREEALKEAGFQRTADLSHGLGAVLQEFDVLHQQTSKRRELLGKIESELDPGKSAGVISFIALDALTAEDIPAIADALLHVGDVEVLNLVIDSPGGDGAVAEKLINLCRAYCRFFRVIIPHRAKSAATIVALGADEIAMGFCSELGPIDAQVAVRSNGVLQLVSAQSFIDARDNLEKRFAELRKNGQDTQGVLQQLAVLDIPYIEHCVQLMAFGKEVARQVLGRYMFRELEETEKTRRINRVLDQLSSVQQFRIHGRMIDGVQAKVDLKLSVRQFGKDDALWGAIWGYYLRASAMAARLPASVVVETKASLLHKTPTRG